MTDNIKDIRERHAVDLAMVAAFPNTYPTPENGWQAYFDIRDLFNEIDRLTEENAICRDAIEEAMELVMDWECDDAHGTDWEQGAARATRRMLNEAIGKAVPRLMMERKEGQKLYGLNWRELREERDRFLKTLINARVVLEKHRGKISASWGPKEHEDIRDVCNEIDALIAKTK